MQIYNIWCGSSRIQITIGSRIGPADPMVLLDEIREADSVAVSGTYQIGFANVREALDFLYRRLHLIKASGGLIKSELGYCWIFRGGKWDLPKGKGEPGETHLVAARREIKEECGLGDLVYKGWLGTTRHVYFAEQHWHFKITYWFKFFSPTTEVKPESEEGIERVEWLDQQRMLEIIPKTWASLAEMLQRTRPWH